MHLKATTYIRCFIDMSLYNNFNEEKKAHELWEKIDRMLENNNAVTRTGEEAETKVYRTRRSRGRGQSQGGGLLVSIGETEAFPKELPTHPKGQRGSLWCRTEKQFGEKRHVGNRDKRGRITAHHRGK